jgi:hypothetical protein
LRKGKLRSAGEATTNAFCTEQVTSRLGSFVCAIRKASDIGKGACNCADPFFQKAYDQLKE